MPRVLAFSPELPFTPGQEVCGTVVEAGRDVPVTRGSRVMGVTRFPSGHGGFAEQSLLGSSTVFEVPDAMSDIDAAGFGIGWSTAWVALVRRARLEAGEQVLVLGAAGGSGAAAVQLAAALGARVIAVVGDTAKAGYCRELGADVVVDRRRDDVADAVRVATNGRGVDVVFDPVGGEAGEGALRGLANEGRFLAVGFASGRWPDVDVRRLVGTNVSVLGVYVGVYSRDQTAGDHEQLVAMLADGRIHSCVTDVATFADLPVLLERVARGDAIGKAVVVL